MNFETILQIASISGISTSVLLVVVLHRVEPEFDPSWRMLSEYSLGRFGWLMRLAFIFGAVGVASGACLFIPSTPGGAIALILTTFGPLGAAFVDTDSITTPRNKISTRSKIHSTFGSLYILGFPIAATIAGTTSGNAFLGWSSMVPWIGITLFMVATLRNADRDGVGRPSHKIGWPNRINMATYFSWILVVVGASIY